LIVLGRAGIGGEFFRSAPKLKLVQLLSAGFDRVDIEAARKAKVPVSNNGGANAIAVSEHTVLLMLAVLKRLVRLHNDIVAGKWRDTATKKGFYKRVVELLGETPGVRPEDVQIILSPNDRDDWSFGNGLASYVKD